MRVVSLIASATEIVCALGCESMLVGRSHECDFPESVARLPVCTEPKFDVSGSSGDIDRRVKDVLRDGLSVYRVFADVLDTLEPDVIVTQSHCDVCAVSLRDVEAATAAMVRSRPKVVSLTPDGLADVFTGIGQVAAALGVDHRGVELVADMKVRLAEIGHRAGAAPHRPTVALVEWVDPLMAAGNWMPDLARTAGGEPLFGAAGKHSPYFTWDQLRAADPDVVVVLPCGFDIPGTRAEMPTLAAKPGWAEMKAVRARRVFVADGNAFFNRPGPRLVESTEMLAAALQPDLFPAEHPGIEQYPLLTQS